MVDGDAHLAEPTGWQRAVLPDSALRCVVERVRCVR